MRTALLSSLENTPDGGRRAFQRLGGRPIIDWQMDLAIELGCKRVVCLGSNPTSDLDRLKKRAEQAGLEFHLINGPLPLVGLLSADQELLVVADGLIADRELVHSKLGEGRGVLALPDGPGIEAGFERIDATHSWGGILLARANIAEQLADMPADSDTVSLLLRLALQSGTRLIPLDESVLESGELLLLCEPAQLEARETALLDHGIERSPWIAPGTALGNMLARALAPGALERGPEAALAIGAIGLLGGPGLAAYGWTLAGLASVAIACFAVNCGTALSGLRARLRGASPRAKESRIIRTAQDLSLIGALSLPFSFADALSGLFLPLLLVGLVHLAEQLADTRIAASWRDRSLLAVLLMISAWLDQLVPAMAGLSLFALAYCLFFRPKTKITRA